MVMETTTAALPGVAGRPFSPSPARRRLDNETGFDNIF
jgi:hypothetical protein